MAGCRILILVFDGFASCWPNPAGELVKRLDGRTIGDCRMESRVAPVDFRIIQNLLREGNLSVHRVILGLELSTSAGRARLELVAVNIVDYYEGRLGEESRLTPVVDGDPLILSTGLSFSEIISSCRERGLPWIRALEWGPTCVML